MSKATQDPKRYNHSSNTPFSRVLEKEISRRSLLKNGAGLAALTMMGGFGLSACSDDNDSDNSDEGQALSTRLGFESIAGSRTDAVSVPPGYSAQVLAPWGTPLNSSAAAWQDDGSNSAEDQLNAVGMHHDGMRFFPLNDSSTDGLLCINHEYIDQNALHPTGPTRDESSGLRTVAEEIRKEIYAHGVTVVRIQKSAGRWSVVTDDEHNRRITGASECDIAGPLAGHADLITPYSPNGLLARGTLNNCGNGYTPWGTYLTCEENWPGYFCNHGTMSEAQQRIGLSSEPTRYGWEELAGDASETDDEFGRFNVTPLGSDATADYRNEANGHGYVVEIDPYDPTSRVVKRSALGRFRHESVAAALPIAGKPLVFYSGHDSRFEYVYKFVSAADWDPTDADRSDRMAVGAKYLDEGTLYVARFDEGGTGQWLPLTPASPTTDGGTLADTFADQAAIILNTCGAADLVGATPMDRPEWIAVDPLSGDVYATMTNNTARTGDDADNGVNAANPRLDNAYGHIIRWRDDADDATAMSWDFVVFGAPDDADAGTNLSGLTALNQFASPDGLVFDDRGILWIQTDNGAEAVTEDTNDQILLVIPAELVDSGNDTALINADNQHILRRFFVGPNGCEVTGLAYTPDNLNFFANIQHPANWPYSDDAAEATPDGTSVRPRAATVAISKDDGGEVGL
ncbi:PhoX family phosphatase [Granulosicoccaceae sp. 1_MG-2023]|nr:PhoX family phosphatase [Granulosicoccaceae sp. 1_MG-2023]